MALDDVIIRIGEFGRYQLRTYILLCLPIIFCAMHKICGSFLNFKPEFTCGEKKIFLVNDTCRNCDEFIFAKDVVDSSTTTEWNLVCDKEWMRSVAESVFMTGSMLGPIILGAFSDKFGRRPIFFFSLIVQLVAGVLVALAPNYILYVILRLIVGTSVSGVYTIAYVMAMEMVGPSKRRITGICCQIFWMIGYVTVGVLAYFIRDWRHRQLVMTLPSVGFLVYWWFMPESTRWLLATGRVEKAKDILQLASKKNHKEISRDTLDELLDKNPVEPEESSLINLMIKYPILRKKTIIICIIWTLISCTYFGLSWGAANLSGNQFLNHTLSGLLEGPVYVALIYTVDILGRKKILYGSMMLTGAALFASGFYVNQTFALVTFYMFGKVGITAAYAILYLFTAEISPTVVRNVIVGAGATSAGFGGIIATHADKLESISNRLPFFVLGSTAFFVCVLFTYLPETLNKKLPETMKDGEEFEK